MLLLMRNTFLFYWNSKFKKCKQCDFKAYIFNSRNLTYQIYLFPALFNIYLSLSN